MCSCLEYGLRKGAFSIRHLRMIVLRIYVNGTFQEFVAKDVTVQYTEGWADPECVKFVLV